MAPRQKGEGFGFIPAESEHHFLVTIPASKEESVYISEHLTWDDSEARRQLNFALGHEDSKIRVVLPRYKWEVIADAVRAEFNQRLRKNGLTMGKWKAGQTPLSRLFGKELVLLAWAIEDADPALIPIAIKNWLGLAPEERWWLFTMTNAATGHAVTTGLNLRVSPNDGLQLLALAVLLAPPLDNPEEFGVLGQKRHQIVTLATLYGSTIVVEGAKDHLHRDALQGFAQGLRHLLADGYQHGIENQGGIDLQLDGIGGPRPHVSQIQQPLGQRERVLDLASAADTARRPGGPTTLADRAHWSR